MLDALSDSRQFKFKAVRQLRVGDFTSADDPFVSAQDGATDRLTRLRLQAANRVSLKNPTGLCQDAEGSAGPYLAQSGLTPNLLIADLGYPT